MSDLLSQDDLNALLGGLSGGDTAPPRKEATIIGDNLDGMLSQDDLNALLGATAEAATAPRKEPTITDTPAPASGGESMSQEEIDELLRQFDRDV